MIAIVYDPAGGQNDDAVLFEEATVEDTLKRIINDPDLLSTLEDKAIEFFASRDYLKQGIWIAFDNVGMVATMLGCRVREQGVNPGSALASCNVLLPMICRADQMIRGLNQLRLEEREKEDLGSE